MLVAANTITVFDSVAFSSSDACPPEDSDTPSICTISSVLTRRLASCSLLEPREPARGHQAGRGDELRRGAGYELIQTGRTTYSLTCDRVDLVKEDGG
eukprot:42229-Eustigmatos_ZCMA.PRE.1